MSAFVTPVVLVVGVGFIAAVILTLAAKFMAVPVDETAAHIREALPGANCGACGYAGCDDYAAALAADPQGVVPNLCTPGGASVASAIGTLLGVDAGASDPMVASVMCSGLTELTKRDMEYQGYKTCASVKQFFGGPNSCKYGCIGYGDCVEVCQYDAIHICNGVALVDRDNCVGCTLCAKECPQGIIHMIPAKSRVFVSCSSKDTGKHTKDICEVGCIACKLCEKACKFDAVHVVDNIAKIDPVKCVNCGLCAKACPRDIIHMIPKPKAAKPAAAVAAKAEAAAQ
ncbi:MAG TPA: RnfABCDGE type electron transport complex subunit B [Bacillota bacterium]|nr:RnfABCDGE type electron transport complex subunit B [Bacillota bacterium]